MNVGPMKNMSPKSLAVFAGITLIVLLALWHVMSYGGSSLSLRGDRDGGMGMAIAPSMGNPVAQNARMGVMSKTVAMDSAEYAYEESMPPMMPDIMPVPGSNAPAGMSKIVKNGDLTLLVEDVDAAAKQVTAVRVKYGGQIGNESFNDYASSRMGDMTIWVPSEHFDAALADIKAGALRVTNERVNVSDVSAQFVDIEAQLKNLRVTESGFQELMKRSGKISEVLEVSRALSNTRSQIEQLQGQLNYLSRQVALSSIHVTLTEEIAAPLTKNEWRPVSVVRAAWREMLRDLTDLIDIVLVLVVKLPVFLLTIAFWGAILYGLWRIGGFAYRHLSSRTLQ